MTNVGSQHKSERSFSKVKVGTDVKTIRKSSLCWLLNERSNKLSADRLIRVRGNANVSNMTKKKAAAVEIITGTSIKLEQYYAVFYDDGWYIGRDIEVVQEKEGKRYRIKFLQERLGQFHWPKQSDIQLVEEDFIFFGPIHMIGNLPMEISPALRGKIIQKFRDLKRDLKSTN